MLWEGSHELRSAAKAMVEAEARAKAEAAAAEAARAKAALEAKIREAEAAAKADKEAAKQALEAAAAANLASCSPAGARHSRTSRAALGSPTRQPQGFPVRRSPWPRSALFPLYPPGSGESLEGYPRVRATQRVYPALAGSGYN